MIGLGSDKNKWVGEPDYFWYNIKRYITSGKKHPQLPL